MEVGEGSYFGTVCKCSDLEMPEADSDLITSDESPGLEVRATVQQPATFTMDASETICSTDDLVLSALSGTTNALVAIAAALTANDQAKGAELIEALFAPYHDFVSQLYSTVAAKGRGTAIINAHHEFVKGHLGKSFDEKETKILLAEGELISTALFQEYLLL